MIDAQTTASILRNLTVFTVAASKQNYSVTAEITGMTQPAITKAIKRLEKLFGTKMFERSGRGMVLTAAGQAVFKHSKSVDDLVRLMHTEVADLKAANEGLIRLGASPVLVETIVMPAMTKLLSESSTMQIDLRAQLSTRLLEELRAGSLDMVAGAMPSKISPDLRFDRLGSVRSYVVSRLGHPLTQRPFTLEDLSHQKWLVAPLDAQWMSDIFESANLRVPSFSVRTDISPGVFDSLLANSDLLTVMDTAHLSTATGKLLTSLPAPAPTRELHFAIFWRHQSIFSPAMKRCRQELKRAYRNSRKFGGEG